jgi:hypothetical protein
VASYYDPINAGFGATDTRGCVAILALHVYHIVMYRPLPWIDWVFLSVTLF